MAKQQGYPRKGTECPTENFQEGWTRDTLGKTRLPACCQLYWLGWPSPSGDLESIKIPNARTRQNLKNLKSCLENVVTYYLRVGTCALLVYLWSYGCIKVCVCVYICTYAGIYILCMWEYISYGYINDSFSFHTKYPLAGVNPECIFQLQNL